MRQKAESDRRNSQAKTKNLTPVETDQLIGMFNAGRYAELESRVRELLERHPHSGFVWQIWGAALKMQGKEAVPALQKATELLPDDAKAHYNLGVALQDLGRLNDAVASYRRALKINPDYVTAHNNLGNALHGLGQYDNAMASYRRALKIDPDYADAHSNLGNTLRDLGQLGDAVMRCRLALKIKPDFAAAHNNLGNALRLLGQLDDAMASFRRALEIEPDYAEVHSSLGGVLMDLGQLDGAVASFRRALEIKPDYAEAHSNLGNALQGLGQLDGAVASYRRALEIKPDYAEAYSNLLFCISHNEAVDAQALFAEHCRFGEQFEAPHRAGWPQHGNLRDPERRLRVGFVSADLYNHAIASFFEPLLARLVEFRSLSVTIYYNNTREDQVTQRLRGLSEQWHAIAPLSDAALAQKIVEDGIDILIDLSGHTGKNRLLSFSRKPAPVQASWMGYPGTTGLQAMDYYLADRFFMPPGQFDAQFTEKIVRLPATAPFLPNPTAPPVNALPAMTNGYVTFGSFNRMNKLSPAVIALWSQLLRALPDARMVLGGMPENGNNEHLIDWFLQQGIARERLSFYPRSDMAAYLASHHQVDICLDTFPYAGSTTTLHALWMGVPTLTLAGRTLAGRAGATILGYVGLEEFVALDHVDFVQKGLAAAADISALAQLRAGLRKRFAESAISRPDVIAAGLERALRIMWQRWCAGLPVESFESSALFELPSVQPTHQKIEAVVPRSVPHCHEQEKMPAPVNMSQLIGMFNAGRYVELENRARELLEQHPHSGLVWKALGVSLNMQGKDALHSLQKATKLLPGDAEVHNYLGNALYNLGRFDDAVASYRRALKIRPDDAEVHSNLGNVLHDLGQFDSAAASCRRALKIKPNFFKALYNLGNAVRSLGQLDDAVASYRRALKINPDLAVAHNNLGNALQALGQFDEAAASYRAALEIKPDYAEAHSNMGSILQALGQQDGAIASCRRALEIEPELAVAHNNLGNALQDLGRLDDAVASYCRALEIKPDYAEAYSNLLFCISHHEAFDVQALFAEHCRFGEQFEAPHRAGWPQHGNLRDPERRLQIGFVSADLYHHPIASFFEPLLARLVEFRSLSVTIYYNNTREDQVTQRLRGLPEHWRDIAPLSDAALAQKIVEDGIDILIDLSGHTGKNRLLSFARKPAPVQVSWMGYPGTTGLQTMDYYLADRFFMPPGQFDAQFTEKIVRLPATAPFLPNEAAPSVNALPAMDNGYITFGSFNRMDKLSLAVIALWSQLLRALPDARMVLGGMPENGNNELLIDWFLQQGIARERLSFYPRSDMAAYLALHHQVDICLDTFPYAGSTTTLHALWMGVPTLTLAGRTLAGRAGATILGYVGLEKFVALDHVDFVQKGLAAAADISALAQLRAGLRERFAQTAINRPDVIAAGLERALRTMWQRWCAGLPAESFEPSSAQPMLTAI